ncbi:MAG: type I methionyl aminopeptidase [Chitinophagales bacterium]|nr:type I methionyl aminopeptidase [Bacteroidota bacterium]MCB9042864.1 type I methionyl aminopeptidase [Chitinophagales bacterium]
MLYYKTPEEVELMRESNLLVSKTHAAVASFIKPGRTTDYLDNIAESFIRDHQAIPAFKGYNDFPATLCISVNEQVVHGIPGKRELREGDVVSIDCGVEKNNYFGDSAYTYALGEIAPAKMKLLRITKEALYKGIEQARSGNRVGDISYAIQFHSEKMNGYGVVRDLVGHGIGRHLHESPSVPNFGKKNAGLRLKKGLVIAIEPMINLGAYQVIQEEDGWTITTKDKTISAHYEHTVAICTGEADILSTFKFLEEEIKKNIELVEIQ